jgi:hypothetical protein
VADGVDRRCDFIDRNREPRHAAGTARQRHRDGGVHQTLLDRRAEPHRRHRAARERGGHLRAIAVVLDALEIAQRDLRIADHDAGRVDEGDAAVRARRKVVGQRIPGGAIEIGARGGGPCDQCQPHEQIGPDAIEQVRLDGGAQVELAGQQRNHDQTERDREQLAADARSHGS